MNVSVFKNLKISKVTGVETIDSILLKIKNGYTKEHVLLAREFGKGTPDYDRVKAEIETFTPNAEFREKRAVVNLVALSGYIYLDVDNYTDRSTFTQTPFIHACWQSLSGNGLGALARIDGLTANNFKLVWLYLEEYFKNQGITIDAQTKDISRQNVISYDPDIYINRDCSLLDANEVVNSNSSAIIQPTYLSSITSASSGNVSSSTIIDNTYYASSDDSLEPLIYKTTLSNYYGEDYIVIEEGKDYRGAYLPRSIGDGKRHFWLASHIITLLFNNPLISYDLLIKEMFRANNLHCQPTLGNKEVIELTKYCFNKHSSCLLIIKTKKKKIWINPIADLTTKEKKVIIGKESGKLRRKNSLRIIQDAYDRLKLGDKKVTQTMVRDLILLELPISVNGKRKGLSLRTIKSRWSEIIK